MQATLSRRTLLTLAAVTVPSIRAQTKEARNKIHQQVDFKTTPARIYEALLDAQQFGAFTGHAAEIEARPGGNLKLFGGLIEGRNIELVPNQRIVQAWREASWSPGYFSLVKFELAAHPPGARIVFDQTGIAENDFGHLNEGWPIRYWDPLRKYLKA